MQLVNETGKTLKGELSFLVPGADNSVGRVAGEITLTPGEVLQVPTVLSDTAEVTLRSVS